MNAPATLVWIAPGPPDADQRKALAGWASSHGVTLGEPAPWRPAALEVDPHVASDVEDLLDRARDALAGTDGSAVDRELAKAETLLRAHPQLPQAAWLMAEVERVRAVRLGQMPPVDAAAATRAWKRAAAIDGGRQVGMAERGIPDRERGPDAAAVEMVGAVEGSEQVWLDGRAVGAHVDTAAGVHTAVVTWGGDPIWAQWREVPAGPSSLALELPVPPPCSVADVARARAPEAPSAEATIDPRGVRCASWVAVLPDAGSSGSVRVAVCSGDRCEPVTTWRLPQPWVAPPPPRPSPSPGPVAGKKPWPSWVVWGAAGVGAALAAGAAVALARSAYPGPAQTRFVDNGIKTQ